VNERTIKQENARNPQFRLMAGPAHRAGASARFLSIILIDLAYRSGGRPG
jgi:hypothetical protein